MRATVLVDNIGSNIGNDTIQGEWGLSFFIEYGEARILLDAGQSALFAENARKLDFRWRKWTMRCSHMPTTIMRTAWRPFLSATAGRGCIYETAAGRTATGSRKGTGSTSASGRKVRALIGGFHLHNKSEKYVREISERIRRTGVEEIFTGHCTGEEAYGIMREELGDRVHQLRTDCRWSSDELPQQKAGK